jgi:hypothetical protein
LSNILYARLLPFVKKEVGSYQAGFWGGKSTTDQIFSLRQILGKSVITASKLINFSWILELHTTLSRENNCTEPWKI